MLIETPAPGTADAARFDDLFRRLYPDLVRLAHGWLGDRHDAEETAQEAFLRLADSPLLARPDAEVAAWLRRVCLNLGLNRRRDERRARERAERAGRLEVVEARGADDPAEVALRGETCAAVRAALRQLPERQAACLLLRHAGYSYAEVAATLEIAVGSVGVLLARAERAFRAAYEEVDHELP